MRHKDPELMKKIHDFAEEYYFSEGYSPSTSEIASTVGIAKTTAYNYLVAMDNCGHGQQADIHTPERHGD